MYTKCAQGGTRILGALAVTGLIFVGASSVQAQPGPGGGHRGPGNPVARLSQELSLSADQQTQIAAIFERHQTERRQAFEANLTPEQKAQWEARRQQHEAQRASGYTQRPERQGDQASGPRGPRTGPGQNMTDEQRQAFHQKMQAERQQIEAEIAAVLTPEQRQQLETLKAQHQRGPGGRGN